MKLNLSIAVLCIGVILTQSAFAQVGTLRGSLRNNQGEPVPFANVAVIKGGDSTLVTGGITDASGAFHLQSPGAGEYFLQCSAVGYTSFFSGSFEVKDKAFEKDFGTIIMSEETALLEEVVVESMRPAVVVEADKMVVNIEGTAMAAGSTAFEILSKLPGVWVDQNGNLQLNGKKGVEVMIDGRPTYVAASELQSLLEGMPAENIRSVEIISNPSAKYDAEGTAGILNIKMKKNTASGMNGGIYGGYQYNQQHLFNTGANLNYKNGKWNSFVNLDLAKRGFVRDQQMGRRFTGERGTATLNQTGKQVKKRLAPSLRIGTDYMLNDRHNIGVMANLSAQDADDQWNTVGLLNDYAGGQDKYIDARNQLDNAFNNALLNLHYTWDIDTSGTSLTANADYVRLSSESNAHFLNSYSFPGNNIVQDEHLSSSTVSAYDIYAARVDLELPLSKATKLEAGVKASHVLSDSQLRFYEHVGEKRTIDTEKSNHFVYEEDIYAGYISFNTRFNDTWNLKGGVRVEQTEAEGRSLTLNQRNPRSYLSLFPSLFIQQNVSNNYQVTYSYSRRIQRPDYERLNPFIFYLDPYTYVEGNPQLRPQYTHALQITQTFLKTYNLVLGFDHSTEVMVEVPLQDPETKETAFANRNMDRFRNYSATIVAPVQLSPKWSVSNNVVMAYQQYSTSLAGKELVNKQFFLMARSNHQLKLPLDIKLEVNAAYQGPLAYGLYRLEDQWWVDAGLKRSFMEDKLDLSLNLTDIFRTKEMVGGSDINGNTTSVTQYFGSRGIRINLRYSFNKGERFVSKDRGVELEELKRAGGD